MLQTIREKTQGWIAGTIISIIILSFALWGIHSYFTSGGASANVATVNGVDITKEQLTVAYERLRRQMQGQYGSFSTPKDEALLKEKALQSLIEVEALKQASVRQGFTISDEQIDDYLQSMPDFQVNGHFSLERFQEVLSATLLSTSEFLDLIKTSLQIDQPRLGIMLTAFSLPDEADNTAALVNQERDINYTIIPMARFSNEPIAVSPTNIEAYYTQHQSEYRTPEQVSVQYVELNLKDLYSRFLPTEAMLKSFYNENINAYTQPTRWHLAGILLPVPDNAPADVVTSVEEKANAAKEALAVNANMFDKLVKQYQKFDLPAGDVAINQLDASLQKSVAGLSQAGEFSDVIRTPQGFVILKVVSVKEPKIDSFDTVKDKVREAYIHQHAEDKFAEMRDQLADLTYEHPDSLNLASQTLNLPIKTSALFTRDKSGVDIAQFKKIRDVAFTNDVLNLQTNSDLIQLNPETVVVLRVKSHLASTLLPLKDVSAQISDKLKLKESEVRANKFASDVVANLSSGADPLKLMKNYQLNWTRSGFLGRYSTKLDSAILDAAFRLPKPKAGDVSYGVTRVLNGYAVVAVIGVKAGDTASAKQHTVFSEQVQNSLGYLEYTLYRNAEINESRIKTNF